MKKIALTLVTILIIGLICMSGLSVSAAEIKRYSTGDETSSDTNTGESEQTPSDNNDEAVSLPSKYSSQDLGYTTPVRSQIGGTCWIHASLSTFESVMLKNNNFYGDLNIDSLNYWGTLDENGFGWNRDYNEAGYTSISVGYFMSWSGPVTNNESAPQYGATSIRFYTKNDRTAMKQAIMEQGAVAANLNDNSLGRSLDRNSFYISDSVGRISGHSISVVGWDDNYSKDNFTGNYHPENDGAWLCKNSWGSNDNSIGGYLWISYEDYYFLNNEYFDDGFGIESYQKIKDTDHLYQNEKYGATYEFSFANESKQTFFNVFDFSEAGNVLDKVIFESPSVGAQYNIYYVPLDSEQKPAQNRAKWTQLGSGTVDFHGYICCDFDDVTISKNKAAIAVELNTSDGSGCVMGVSEWLRDIDTGKMIFIDPCTKGSSFVEYSEGIVDVKDFYINKLDDDIGGTPVIKAITNKTTVTDTKGDVDLNEEVNINDATLIQLYLAGLRADISGDQLINADYNGDGRVNINDTTAIQLALAGNI